MPQNVVVGEEAQAVAHFLAAYAGSKSPKVPSVEIPSEESAPTKTEPVHATAAPAGTTPPAHSVAAHAGGTSAPASAAGAAARTAR
jgi:hypothetical protein